MPLLLEMGYGVVRWAFLLFISTWPEPTPGAVVATWKGDATHVQGDLCSGNMGKLSLYRIVFACHLILGWRVEVGPGASAKPPISTYLTDTDPLDL